MSVYLTFNQVFIFMFPQPSTWDPLLHFAFISVSLPPDVQVYTARGSPQSRRNASGATARTCSGKSPRRNAVYV